MAVNIPRLRRWFALAAIAVLLAVAGFYFYARMRVRRALQGVETRLGVNVQQSTEGFSLSKSEGGRTIFTIRAGKAVHYREGGRAELHDVNIVVYGRRADRFDQIYGSHFEYDPQSGEVVARGEVHIDLEGDASGPVRPDQSRPAETKNPIHLKTSGLVFSQKTGLAHTDEVVEFRFPQASGTAKGATYDSRANVFTLKSDVRVVTPGANSATVLAKRAAISKEPRQAVLEGVRVERGSQVMEANRATALLRENNSVSQVVAMGDVSVQDRGKTAMKVRAPRADLYLNENSALRSAALSGGVDLESGGAEPMAGRSGVLLLDFNAASRLEKARAAENVKLSQKPTAARPQEIDLLADGMDFQVRGGGLERATTSGAAQVEILQPEGQRTVVTAGRFDAAFAGGRVKAIQGAPDVRAVSTAPGQPNRVSTSREMNAAFAPGGGLESIVQQGDFHYQDPGGSDPGRQAWAEKARYAPADETLVLTGSPRVVEGGMTITAQKLRLNRRSGEALAEGDVKTTYSELKPQPAGAMLATGDPLHVTAKIMTAKGTAGVARYSGGARLWQGANIVQAPVIEFDRERRRVVAYGGNTAEAGSHPVSTVFVQREKSGKVTPVNVTAARLSYTDADRKARFEGGVVLRGADATVTADEVEVFLMGRGQARGSGAGAPSQIERVVASNHVTIQEPTRKATGDRLTYLAGEGKFVLSGGSPSIFDAERGKITGDSLTFYSHDDRVVVAGSSSPTVTQTRVRK